MMRFFFLKGRKPMKPNASAIPCEDFTFIYGNNQSECACSYSTMKKKLNTTFVYKFVREGCARNELRTTYASTHQNTADLHHYLQ